VIRLERRITVFDYTNPNAVRSSESASPHPPFDDTRNGVVVAFVLRSLVVSLLQSLFKARGMPS
jgi:hypothetical protein